MLATITEQIIQLIIVSPIVLIALKNKKIDTLKTLFMFGAFFIVHGMLLYLPIEYKELQLIGKNWNWSGKFYAILGSMLFLLLYRKFELKDYYLTLNQNKTFFKKGTIIVTAILLITSIMTFVYSSPKDWDTETILYQLTMPGIDEEIAYRGIMLGLLMKTLKSNFQITFFHPAILVTGILFGLGHGLSITSSYELVFRFSPFLRTTMTGMVWGWLTVKSGSIVLALISHNLGNVTNKLIRMK